MNAKVLTRRYPVPSLATAVSLVSLAVTAAYWAGLVPGVAKTLPTFVNMVIVTLALLAGTLLAWGVALLTRPSDTEST